ncbi:uncharacterized protein LOC115450397 [Manduca sexta]|uniref:uncharacterized protein LOC115450397 n=1 Tax=Manduca sexta TaxID=7130 RepID=UPI001183B091|nr:uncharacterized protein LOC115450397 [Manduca sexta]
MLVTINISLVCVVGTMHVSTQMIVVAILLTYGTLTNQTPVENITIDIVTPSETTAPVLKNCTTGHGTAGGCVDRTYCDYGTPAIDFTSYAPKGYRKSCSDKEVCCPFSAQLPILPKKNTTGNEDFDFNDDDD